MCSLQLDYITNCSVKCRNECCSWIKMRSSIAVKKFTLTLVCYSDRASLWYLNDVSFVTFFRLAISSEFSCQCCLLLLFLILAIATNSGMLDFWQHFFYFLLQKLKEKQGKMEKSAKIKAEMVSLELNIFILVNQFSDS